MPIRGSELRLANATAATTSAASTAKAARTIFRDIVDSFPCEGPPGDRAVRPNRIGRRVNDRLRERPGGRGRAPASLPVAPSGCAAAATAAASASVRGVGPLTEELRAQPPTLHGEAEFWGLA